MICSEAIHLISTHRLLQRDSIYAGRSSDPDYKQALSIPLQIEELRKLAVQRGIAIAAEYREEASAREPGRPVFGELMRRVEAGEVTAILCWRRDRLARNIVDGVQLVHDLAEGPLDRHPEATYTGPPTPGSCWRCFSTQRAGTSTTTCRRLARRGPRPEAPVEALGVPLDRLAPAGLLPDLEIPDGGAVADTTIHHPHTRRGPAPRHPSILVIRAVWSGLPQ